MFLTQQNKNPDQLLLARQNTLRILVGVLGIFLPIMLWGFLWYDSGYSNPLESISHYYYTRVSGVFIITVSLLAIFLIIYKGKQRIDFLLSTLAGVFALLLVLFPTNNINADLARDCNCSVTLLRESEFRSDFHYASAAIFLLSLALMSLFLFTKSDKPRSQRTRQKKIRNVLFRICGIVMIVAMLTVLFEFLGWIEVTWFGNSLTFWMETFAVEAFGFAWLIKAEVFLKDKPKIEQPNYLQLEKEKEPMPLS